MDGALGPQTLEERERAHAERGLGPPLEGAPAGADRRRELPDIQRPAEAIGQPLAIQQKSAGFGGPATDREMPKEKEPAVTFALH